MIYLMYRGKDKNTMQGNTVKRTILRQEAEDCFICVLSMCAI